MIIVFAGAGASKAVNPHRYPTTVEFFERLPEQVKSNKLFQLALEYLGKQVEGPLDIEHVLWLIKDLREFTSKAFDATSVVGWFLQSNRLAQLTPGSYNLEPLQPVVHDVTARIDSLWSSINALVYDLYGEPPKPDELEGNWVPLLTGLMEKSNLVELVTTNYDIVIEEAITITNAPVVTGRTTAIQPTLDKRKWDPRDPTVEAVALFGRLTKLHGSVDWVKANDRIYVGTPLFQGRHERHAIIYPGFKGVPEDPFFQQLHRYFQERLSQADTALFIGYAFRDEYINNLLQELPPSCKILVLNPIEPPSLPFAAGRYKAHP